MHQKLTFEQDQVTHLSISKGDECVAAYLFSLSFVIPSPKAVLAWPAALISKFASSPPQLLLPGFAAWAPTLQCGRQGVLALRTRQSVGLSNFGLASLELPLSLFPLRAGRKHR
eukprot:scaffold42157_cov17-Tisochrysis_lutea.AAC.2